MNPNTRYPIGNLLLERLIASGLSLSHFVATLGYQNTNNGIRTFHAILETGQPNGCFLERLQASQFRTEPETLRTAILDSATQIRLEAFEAHREELARRRLTFRPEVEPITEQNRPSSITLFALMGGLTRFTMPLPGSFESWEPRDQRDYLQPRIRNHFYRNRGIIPFLGAIVGYRAIVSADQPAMIFTIDGQPSGSAWVTPPPQYGLTIRGGRSIVQLLNQSDRQEDAPPHE